MTYFYLMAFFNFFKNGASSKELPSDPSSTKKLQIIRGSTESQVVNADWFLLRKLNGCLFKFTLRRELKAYLLNFILDVMLRGFVLLDRFLRLLRAIGIMRTGNEV
jgi:hypothetical protein